MKILIGQELFLIFISLLWFFFTNNQFFLSFNFSFFISLISDLKLILTGFSSGIILFLLGTIITISYDPFREALKKIDYLIINYLKSSDFITIAIFSGIGEELFFRGVLQNEIGIIWASLFFALMHIPSKDLWVYGLWAFFASMYLGNIYEYTNSLLIVIIAHAINNLSALILWKKFKYKIIKN